MAESERMKRKKNEKRDQILESARKLFLEHGYANTRMEDIARDADLAIGTLYLYFANKNDVYASLCEDGLEILDGLFADAVKQGKDCWEKMARLGEINLRFYREHPAYYDMLTFVFLDLKPEDLSRDIRQTIMDRINGILKHLETVVQEGIDAGQILDCPLKETVLLLWGTVLGMVCLDRSGFAAALGTSINELARIGASMAFRSVKA